LYDKRLAVPRHPLDSTCQIPSALVREHLDELLRSPEFSDSPRLSRFLQYVVNQTLEGHAGEFKEYRVGVDVFDRAADYDPKTDPVVRVQARQLRFRLGAFYAAARGTEDIVISIPKGGYSARFDRAAAPPPRASDLPAAPSQDPVPHGSGRLRIGVFALALLAAGSAALAWRAIAARSVPQPSIAVLPFINLGNNPDNEYFCDGLTDGIIDELARLHTMRVIARSSAFQFKGKTVDAREVGRQLNVASLLEGRVSREAGRVKIAVQLERVSDGSILWSQIYERPLADVFALQTEVAVRVAADLGIVRGGGRRPGTRDAEAQDHYMHARFEAEKFTKDGLARAITEYQRALDRDPEYTAAWYGLAVARHRRINDRPLESGELAQIAAGYRKAVDLDPGSADAHAGLALMAMQFDWDWARAEQELKTALALGPTAIVEGHFGVLLTTRGQFAEAEEHLRRALDLDPLGTAVRFNAAICRFYAGRYELARLEWERHPEIPRATFSAAWALMLEGRNADALERFRALHGRVPEGELFEGIAQAATGNGVAALELIRGAEEHHEQIGISLYYLAIARASIHDDNAAMQWLDKSIGRREASLMFIGQEPAFAQLRAQPAFRAYMARVGQRY
jgi:TolB-like protein/tetratricopeptide (TPR) repeat protein